MGESNTTVLFGHFKLWTNWARVVGLVDKGDQCQASRGERSRGFVGEMLEVGGSRRGDDFEALVGC
jgi:hypothetical protein